jgi:hypothetical protein
MAAEVSTNRLRPWLLAALLLAVVLVAAQQWWIRRGDTLFPDLDRVEQVAKVEMARGREQVVLARRADTGAWSVLSAADAPGNEARITATLQALKGLRGKGEPGGAEDPRIEPLELRLSDASDRVLGHARILPGKAIRAEDGMVIPLEQMPALPLWQSAWSDLEPPRIRPADIVAVHRIGPNGRELLDDGGKAAVADMLDTLTAQGFMAAATVPWASARTVQLTMADGALVDIQQVPLSDRMHLIRMTSDSRPDIRVAREWAFRTTRTLP